MIKYSEIQPGEILRIVGAGAPGYASNGDLVKVKSVASNGCTVLDKNNAPCEFVFDCGADRLEKTEFGIDSDLPPPAHPHRVIGTHKVNGANESLELEVMDEPSSGGANHLYRISGYNAATGCGAHHGRGMFVPFQKGPIKEAGVNGVTQEVLLAIVKDRLESFQAGPFACDDNAEALSHVDQAIECLQRRTKARIARGVEGTHQQ